MNLQVIERDGEFRIVIPEADHIVGRYSDIDDLAAKMAQLTEKAYFIAERDGKFCVMKGTREKPEGTEKCHDSRKEATAHLRALYANVEDAKSETEPRPEAEAQLETEKAAPADNISGNLMHGEGGILNPGRGDHTCKCPKCGAEKSVAAGEACNEVECPECGTTMRKKDLSSFTVYKAGDEWRWTAVSNVAVMDREGEIVTEKAYDDAIKWAQEAGQFGELDLVHVDGTDVGDCDFQTRVGPMLIESGTWRNTPLATRVRKKVAEKGDEAISIKFRFDRDQFDGVQYNGGIQIIKRTILPRDMAASYGTAIAVSGGEEMKGIDEKAREVLRGYGYEDAEIDALAAKQIQDDDVVEKEAIAVEPGLWKKIVSTLLGKREEAEKEVEETVEEKEVVTPDMPVEDIVKALAPTIGAAIAEALTPVRDSMEKLEEWKKRVEEGIAETQKDLEEKANEILDEQPPIVRAPVTMTAAAVVKEQIRNGTNTEAKALMDQIAGVVDKVLEGRGVGKVGV